jgi:endonuclease I
MKKKAIPALSLILAALLLSGCATTTPAASSVPVSSSEPSSLSSSSSASAISSTFTSSQSNLSSTAKEYYKSVDLTATGSALRGNLATFLNSQAYSVPGWDALATTLPLSDEDLTNTNNFISFYSAKPIPKQTSRGSKAGTWNNEHVWPNSRGVGKAGPGADPHMIRPTWADSNSVRGNKFYGYSTEANCYDPASENVEQYRGDAARIIFYTATRYWKLNGLELSDNASDDTSLKTMGRKTDLLAWNTSYAPSEQEKYRNEYLFKNYNVRNPFIDFPSLATSIWGN